jgi:hypothetical protein
MTFVAQTTIVMEMVSLVNPFFLKRMTLSVVALAIRLPTMADDDLARDQGRPARMISPTTQMR